MSLSGGEIASESLSRYGIRTVFAVAAFGTPSCSMRLDRDGFRIISSRHESGCGFSAADGYARITGRLGVALIIANQARRTNQLGIAAAFHACSPVLILIARLPIPGPKPSPSTTTPSTLWSAPSRKWCAHRPRGRAARGIHRARQARSARSGGRCGPVVLQIPQEYL